MTTRRRLYVAFVTLGLAIFGVEVWGTARWASSLGKNTDQLEATTHSLRQETHQVIDLVIQAKWHSEELNFLQGLQNLLPQDKGYLRTQKAMLDEMQALRKKVGMRLRGRLHILVDTKANKLYLKRGLTLLWEADCSVGRGGILIDKRTGRRWEFVTPRGQFEILGKVKKPVWIKPDWAYVESKELMPPPEDPIRKVEGELGSYLLNLGDGYLIHGTKNEQLLGQAVSHGCIRLGTENLEKLYQTAPLGTPVYIY